MLRLILQSEEVYDEVAEKFYYTKSCAIEFEHSLLSISKWEEKYQKPFYSREDKTSEETLEYIKCMIVSPDIDPDIVYQLKSDDILKISEYINAPMTATWFNELNKGKKESEIITAEIIYYWMVELQIPIEWETRHINKLLTLVRVTTSKRSKPKKMSQKEIMRRYDQINAQRCAKLHSKG